MYTIRLSSRVPSSLSSSSSPRGGDSDGEFILVSDKLNQKEKSALNKRLSQTGLNSEQIIQTSSLDKVNINNLAKAIEKIVFDK